MEDFRIGLLRGGSRRPSRWWLRWVRDQVAALLAVVMVSTVVVAGAVAVEPVGAIGSEPVVHFIIDVSASMNLDADPGNSAAGSRLDVAKAAISSTVNALPSGVALGLRPYSGGCVAQSSSPLVPVGTGNASAVLSAVSGLQASGGTPTPQALQSGIDDLVAYSTSGEKRIVLVTDGQSSCGKICPVVEGNAGSGVDFTLYTVGIGTSVDGPDLECAASSGGGEYLSSENIGDLPDKISEAVTSGSYVWPFWRFFGGQRDSVVGAGDPVGTAYGNFYDTFVDLPATAGVFGLDVSRSYNSLDEQESVLGRGWRAPFSATAVAEGDDVRLTTGDGRQIVFEGDGSGGWEKALEFNGVISKPPYSGFLQ